MELLPGEEQLHVIYSQFRLLNRAMRYLTIFEPLTSTVPNIYKTQKILQLKDIYNLEVSKFMYKYRNSQLPVYLTII